MTFRNESKGELPLEKVCLRTSFLGIYRGRDRLWTSDVSVVSTSPSQPQKIDIREGAPAEAPGAVLLSGPRETRKGGIMARTFDLIQSIPGADLMME
jgi:hypothetical protein